MKTYAIHWKSTASGRIGIGTLLFEKDDAERLATELNEKFPDIDHEAMVPAPCVAQPGHDEAASPQAVEPLTTLLRPQSAS